MSARDRVAPWALPTFCAPIHEHAAIATTGIALEYCTLPGGACMQGHEGTEVGDPDARPRQFRHGNGARALELGLAGTANCNNGLLIKLMSKIQQHAPEPNLKSCSTAVFRIVHPGGH